MNAIDLLSTVKLYFLHQGQTEFPKLPTLHSLLCKVVRKHRFKGETVTTPLFCNAMFACSPCNTYKKCFRALLALNTKDKSLHSVPLTNFKVMQTPKR